MYSDSDLEAAVSAGALSPRDAQKFRDFVAQSHATPAVDEEHFRLLTGFNDIFVAIAAVILLVAVAWIGYSIPPHLDFDGPSPVSGVLVAGAAWGLAEFFTRKRRMALPSILLLLAFVGGVFEAVAVGLMVAGGVAMHGDGPDSTVELMLAVAAAVASGAAWLHWRRFRVPITMAAGAGAVSGVALALASAALDGNPARHELLLGCTLILGIGVFLVAMRWDASDPQRQTRRSDVAFWLHLLAAPMIVHPIFVLLGINHGQATTPQALIVLAVYALFGVTALAIDRRALLVSALAYVLYALNGLFQAYGVVELSVAFTALLIGSALLLLSAFWQHARRGIVHNLPTGLQTRLPVVDRLAAA